MTETISCEVEAPKSEPQPNRETEFEKRRGVSRIEMRSGFAQVHVTDMPEPIVQGRLKALRAIADTNTSIDFLKLSPSGLSFLVAEDRAELVKNALNGNGFANSVISGRSIVLVHAVNMRHEEGMIASIVEKVIASGANVDHIGDMHDRLLMVAKDADAERLAASFKDSLVGENA